MHHFTDFKGFSEAQIDLSQPLTILIGPNGAGKSNLIEGVELLSFIANGGLLYEVTEINQGGTEEIRGGLQACTRHSQNSFTLGFSGGLKFEGKPKSFSYRVTIPRLNSPLIVSEQLLLDDKPLFKTVPRTGATPHSHQVQYNNFERGGNKPHVSVSSMQSVLSQYPAFASKNKKRQACLKVVTAITNYLRASFVFDPNPKLMREYVRIGNSILTKNGANLSAVLYALSQGTEAEKQSLQRLLQWIRQLPGEPYQDFEFVVVKELNDVIFGFKEKEHDTSTLTSAKVLSDGTLRCLAVLTALETVEPRSRIIIEEFDNGLHPSRVKVLVKAVEDCCQRRLLNILVTTHNPATLNALSPAQLDGVVLCSWDKSSHSSKLLRLRELHYQDELLERGQLGDLVTRQVVDHYLSPNFEQDRKDKALTWLADF
jgi:predicted ATPase